MFKVIKVDEPRQEGSCSKVSFASSDGHVTEVNIKTKVNVRNITNVNNITKVEHIHKTKYITTTATTTSTTTTVTTTTTTATTTTTSKEHIEMYIYSLLRTLSLIIEPIYASPCTGCLEDVNEHGSVAFVVDTTG